MSADKAPESTIGVVEANSRRDSLHLIDRFKETTGDADLWFDKFEMVMEGTGRLWIVRIKDPRMGRKAYPSLGNVEATLIHQVVVGLRDEKAKMEILKSQPATLKASHIDAGRSTKVNEEIHAVQKDANSLREIIQEEIAKASNKLQPDSSYIARYCSKSYILSNFYNINASLTSTINATEPIDFNILVDSGASTYLNDRNVLGTYTKNCAPNYFNLRLADGRSMRNFGRS
ncbi:hypothetical protein RF11_02983 [Thelohanellus kitauei]|uniref:Uncharacterized protein n=1 Tax=Thelohanellus kitauei TaxID=669202 RepID=A0A0C2JQ82_THEKT|nr:hypothetical protein RF11_02983 [Thelohanellus kitauei]